MIPIPASWFGLAFLIALVVPGLVFTSVRASLSGSRDVDPSTVARVLQSVVVSAVFDAVFALTLIPLLDVNPLTDPRTSIVEHPRAAAALFLACGVLAPAIVAWLIHGDPPFLEGTRNGMARCWARLTSSPYGSTPTAWDFALERRHTGWVRVRLEKGIWVGGVYDTDSYASTYPRPRDLFIQEQWHLDADGNFTEVVKEGQGLWVAITDGYIVEFLTEAPDLPAPPDNRASDSNEQEERTP